MRRILAGVLVGLVLTAIGRSQAPDQPNNGAASKQLTWDVISVKPNRTLDSSGTIGASPDGVVVQNITLLSIFITAFSLKSTDQMDGLPGWVDSDHFDIQAKMDADTAEAWKKLKGEAKLAQWQSFFRQILEKSIRTQIPHPEIRTACLRPRHRKTGFQVEGSVPQ